MADVDNTYFGIAVFELGKTDGIGKFYREDFCLVYAVDEVTARSKLEEWAREIEYPAGIAGDQSYVRLVHVVDVARTLHDPTGDRDPTRDTVELYSRHFASLETYTDLEMLLGGRDPLDSA
ncbi:DUF4288 domain-containing protein [Rhodococcus sovatensis]|uniref:DUF4288 domain-containing protein n=1 Tax=Rhodococcus sovatensis TaxID=1805840 RepID=A0ABZ2PEZ5_9NOCA